MQWEVRPSPNDANLATLTNAQFPGRFLGSNSEYDSPNQWFDANLDPQNAQRTDWHVDLISQNSWA
jgi:hypothetical protein